MDLIDNCTRSRGKLNRNSYCSWSHSNPTDSNQWMERIEEEMIYIHSISIVCVENCRLIHGLNDTEVTLVTLSFSLLSKPILDLCQIKWAFHRVHSGWIGSTSHPRSHIVVDHLCSHSKASNRAGNDGRSGHDLDLHGHERDAKRDLKPSYGILSQSVYFVALSHGFLVTCLFSPLPPPLPLPPWYNLSHRIERI